MFVNNLAYEASAGSGKTFMLVVRYLSLLFKGADASKILALTFTNKSASEMQERVVATLEDLQNKGELLEIAKVTGYGVDELLFRRKKVLDEFLNSDIKIMTIDSFFTQILRKFSLYVSLMPDFTTMNNQHEIKLLNRFLKEVSVAGKKDILVNLALESNKRITDIFTLLDQFYMKKDEFEGLSFFQQSQQQYEQEVMQSLSVLDGIVQNCKDASSRAKNGFKASNIMEVVKKTWLDRDSLNYSTFKKCFTSEMDMEFEKLKNGLRSYFKAKESNFFYGLNELLKIYIKSKKAIYVDDSELSFFDVTSLVYEILNFLDDSEFIYFRLDSQIEHILLDEFQDTSIIQYKILKPLIDESLSGSGVFDDGSFFFVGDVKQSIYRFRGGVSALFGEVAKIHSTKVEKLTLNYRSQKYIVDFVNNTFINKIKNYTPQKTRDGEDGGYVEVLNSDDICVSVTAKVQQLLEMGANPNEIAILCATNSDGEELKTYLSEQNIPVITETTTKLIEQTSVKAIIEYLKYLYFGEDIYKENFFALIGQETKKIKQVDVDSRLLRDIVINVIDEYKLFDEHFHLIRFVDAISNYKDIEAFLFEYERLSTDSASSDMFGVKILTIHKSKGLEYEHVVVADRLSSGKKPSSTIIYEYDNIVLKDLFLRVSNRSGFDDGYKNALQKEDDLSLEDSLNALYVAFTRAKRNLFVVQKDKNSLFSFIDLSAIQMGVLEVKQKNVVEKDYKTLDYKQLYYGTQTNILNVEDDKQEDIKAVNFGLGMHYMLEMMQSFEEESIFEAMCLTVNKFGYNLEDEEVKEIVSRITRLLNNKQFLSLISDKVYKEQAIKYKNNLYYIDLLVENEDGFVVIDYKSSKKYEKHHNKQVSFYVNAVKTITGKPTKGYVVYLLEDEIEIKLNL